MKNDASGASTLVIEAFLCGDLHFLVSGESEVAGDISPDLDDVSSIQAEGSASNIAARPVAPAS